MVVMMVRAAPAASRARATTWAPALSTRANIVPPRPPPEALWTSVWMVVVAEPMQIAAVQALSL
jgi:hypothetical protein